MAPKLESQYHFGGCWLVQNCPANRVPSHGTSLFGLSYAIDFVPVDDGGRSAPYALTSFLTQRRRLNSGWLAIIGNHVLIETRFEGRTAADSGVQLSLDLGTTTAQSDVQRERFVDRLSGRLAGTMLTVTGPEFTAWM